MTHVLIGVPARAEDKALWEAVPGCEFVYDEAFAAQNLAWADVIFGPVPGKKLALCTRLKWLQYPFAGVERYCLRSDITFPAGVTLTNATGAFGPRIAEYALAAVLGLYNNFPQYRDMQRAGGTQALGMPLSLHGDTVLVIGAGDIGTAFARLTRPFGCRNIAVRRTRAPLGEPFDETYTLRELPALLPQADTVLCALPATRHTQHVMGAEQFALMKKASVFVNVGRGSAVDTDALVAALQAGRPGAAALDVTDPEPLPANHPLRQCPNAFLTPHIAGLSFGHRPEVTDYVVHLFEQNLRRFLAGQPLQNEVDTALGYTKQSAQEQPAPAAQRAPRLRRAGAKAHWLWARWCKKHGFGLTVLAPGALQKPGNPGGLPGFFHTLARPKRPGRPYRIWAVFGPNNTLRLAESRHSTPASKTACPRRIICA